MKKIVLGTFMSLDGVLQAPGNPQEDTAGGFTHGGWQMPYFDDDAGKIISESFAKTYGMLLGRFTYQIFAAYWPQAPADDPVAGLMNNMPKFVVSKTLNEVTWNNSRLIKDNIVEEITRLKQGPGSGDLSVVGSGKLAQTLMQHDLVDEYVLWFHPVVLGSGKRLFADGLPPARLKLIETSTTNSGVVILRYLPDRK